MAKYRKCDICGKYVKESEAVELEYKSKRLFEKEFVRFASDDLCKECAQKFYDLSAKLKKERNCEI